MKIGVIGLGRVGLPLALVLRHDGQHDVVGYDIDPTRVTARMTDPAPDKNEPGLASLLACGPVRLVDSVTELVEHAELVYVMVQTPHPDGYGGESSMPELARDFDYSFLRTAVTELTEASRQLRKRITVVIGSTTLTGTIERELMPLTGDHIDLVYSPVFISLGHVVRDLGAPQLFLIGLVPRSSSRDWPSDEHLVEQLHRIWRPGVHWTPSFAMPVRDAELLKVAYNCWLSLGIAFVNSLQWVCEETGSDVDRIAAGFTRFGVHLPTAGMCEGGACRPRDAIAMRWLMGKLGLSDESDVGDPFAFVSRARDVHTRRLADVVARWCEATGLWPFILGKAYRANVSYQDGSPALLLADGLNHPESWDPLVGDPDDGPPSEPRVFVLATPHDRLVELRLPSGSVLIDPWGVASRQPGVTLVRVGRRER